MLSVLIESTERVPPPTLEWSTDVDECLTCRRRVCMRLRFAIFAPLIVIYRGAMRACATASCCAHCVRLSVCCYYGCCCCYCFFCGKSLIWQWLTCDSPFKTWGWANKPFLILSRTHCLPLWRYLLRTCACRPSAFRILNAWMNEAHERKREYTSRGVSVYSHLVGVVVVDGKEWEWLKILIYLHCFPLLDGLYQWK